MGSTQSLVSLPAPDGVGGALAVWFDKRSGNDDVYAYRLAPDGLVTPEPPAPLAPPLPTSFSIVAAAPNPTREVSTILFDLPTVASVRAEVYDATGHRVRVLAAGEEFAAGRRSLSWDGRRDEGAQTRAGLYFVRLSAGEWTGRAKVVRIR